VKRLLSVLVFSLSLTPLASAQLIDDSVRGNVCTGSNCSGNNNGAGPGTNYVDGFDASSGNKYRNWFEFFIPTLTSPLLSATLNIDEPASTATGGPGHAGGSLTYAVYGLNAEPLAFGDVTTTNPFGSVVTTNASDGTTISITLNSAALADIVAHQGGHIFIGGIDSGETSTTTSAYDFAFSGPGNVTSLNLTTAPVATPEPASVVLFGTLLIGSIVALHRKTRRAE
jgi:hypothetical protein